MLGVLGPEALTTNLMDRNISSTCNSSGSAIWASAKNIKPLVDANCHTEAIEIANHQSPIFTPIHYRNPGSKSHAPSGQTILFGCPLELRTVGELTKIPPVLEYLLDSPHDWPRVLFGSFAVGQKCEIVQLTHSMVRWRNTGLWSMSLSKRGQVWRKVIALSFPTSSRNTIAVPSLWFVCSEPPYGKLKDVVGILYGPSGASMVR